MLNEVRNLLSPPVFPEDEDKTRQARYAKAIALAFLGLVVAYELFLRIFASYSDFSIVDVALFGVAFLCILALYLLRKGYVRVTSLLLVAIVWLASNGLASTGYGARDASYLVNFAIVLMAALLLGWQASIIVTLLSLLSGIALADAEQSGLLATATYPIQFFMRDIAFVFIINGLLIFMLIRGLETALRKSRLNLSRLESANANLNNIQNELQQRSFELLQANRQLEDRTKRLQAIAMVTRAAASMQSFESLVDSIPGSIHRYLGYEHVHLFLLDEPQEFAILSSTNDARPEPGQGGESRVPVRQSGPMAFVVQTGQPRILRPTQWDSLQKHHPDHSDSQWELLLPLNVGEHIIGVLDIHSSRPANFGGEDISELSVLANQLAITLQNLLLYERAQNALREAGVASTQTVAETWSGYQNAIQTKGYRYDGIKSEPLKETGISGNGRTGVAIPIQLRGQTIGSFRLNRSDPSRAWNDDELAMVRATADRVALALEGARLLGEAEKRAAREAFLSAVATRLSSSFQLDSILRDTVQELGEALRNSTVTFQLVNPADFGPLQEKRTGSGADDE